jgi:hypothetical protein
MLHEGRVILDVKARACRHGRADLLHMFEKTRGEKLDDDKLLPQARRADVALHPLSGAIPATRQAVSPGNFNSDTLKD